MKRLAWLKLNPEELKTPSAMLLIAANLVPLYGVFFLDWEVFPVLALFWLENVFIGVFNVFKMLLANPGSWQNWLAKVFMIPFFCFHYGAFTGVHGIFVFGLFGNAFWEDSDFPNLSMLWNTVSEFQLGWAILALFLSHLFSFIFNYIGKGEYKQANPSELMGAPYTRVVILHVTIILGAFLVGALGSPVPALVLLIGLKMFIDIQAHLREHRKREAGVKNTTNTTNIKYYQ